MVPPADEHDCGWKVYALALQKQLADVVEKQKEQQEQLEAVKQKLFGKSREKMPPMSREVQRGTHPDPEKTKLTRQANAELRAKKLETELIDVPVPTAARHCPKCDGREFTALGTGKPSSVTEYVPGYFRKRIFQRETLACRCGQHLVTAPVPDKVFDKTQYGPGFMAHLVVSKCCDSIPIHRIEQQFARLGVPMARSTMNELFHRTGEVLAPIAARILALIAQSNIVLADETPLPMQDTRKSPYIWTFIADNLIAYRFSLSRSGETPKAVLGGTQGTLVVDMYTGYNAITGVHGRERAGCLAHARRKFFKALPSASEAQVALDLIRDIYVLEDKAKQAGDRGNPEHARLRREECLPLMDKLYVWLSQQRPLHPPKSVMGKAIQYSMKNWQALTRFVTNPEIPPDNNRSERALRVVVLGRKNYLFVGSKDGGENLAALYTVVATCVANEIEPIAYLTDVLTRLESTPSSEIDALLPQNWVPPPT
jgi:transposase